ncbi:hypothetical protein M427DRAFT_59718 [Gonapodya prolifera JEL478]|uniref:Phosphoglycerate mutase-like protein n=1 Tax=Gonapodya prolifera (strain JEL478) TaxID=1344416 RepID=A0A139A651_GONPJ|nr:hypothetical protein M427DRAFT_59718 [Gonapodya prolifera JEL478]|eukprot:KXS12204.1 hypothetical protein M427DRAFT_59718 [Gonapodya prolifera JEL478]
MASASASTTSGNTKTVYLVRHAESEENVATITLIDSFRGLYSTPPARPSADGDQTPKEQVTPGFFGRIAGLASATTSFTSILGSDAELSPLGRRQIAEVRDKLAAASFWTGSSKPDLLVHSDMRRTTETAYGIMGVPAPAHVTIAATDRGEGTFGEPKSVAPGLPPVIATSALRERSVPEFFSPAPLDGRVRRFAGWLAARPERTIVVVGHAYHFKLLMNHGRGGGGGEEEVKWKMRNVDVWEGRFVVDGKGAESAGPASPGAGAGAVESPRGRFLRDAWVRRFWSDQVEVNELFDYEGKERK